MAQAERRSSITSAVIALPQRRRPPRRIRFRTVDRDQIEQVIQTLVDFLDSVDAPSEDLEDGGDNEPDADDEAMGQPINWAGGDE